MTVIRSLLIDTMRSIGLLTRVRVSARWFEGFDGRYDRASRAFSAVGALLAFPVWGAGVVAAATGLSSLVTGVVGVAVGIVLTGALHEDGLADTADGLGARNVERRLAIMRDSSIGTYGVLALMIALASKATLLAELLASPTEALAALLAAGAASRAALVWLWHATPAARTDGAAAASGRPTPHAMRVSAALAALAIVPAAIVVGAWPTLAAIVLSLGAIGFLRRVCDGLGGHTGDVLGACVALVEVAMLGGMAMGRG